MPLVNTLVPCNLLEYLHQSYLAKTRFIRPHFHRRQYGSTFNHFDVGIQRNAQVTAVTPFEVMIQGHLFGTNPKHIRDFLLLINTNLHPICSLQRSDSCFMRPNALYRAGLTMVPNVPWHGAPAVRAPPRATKKIF